MLAAVERTRQDRPIVVMGHRSRPCSPERRSQLSVLSGESSKLFLRPLRLSGGAGDRPVRVEPWPDELVTDDELDPTMANLRRESALPAADEESHAVFMDMQVAWLS